jgi:hypothetical protein
MDRPRRRCIFGCILKRYLCRKLQLSRTVFFTLPDPASHLAATLVPRGILLIEVFCRSTVAGNTERTGMGLTRTGVLTNVAPNCYRRMPPSVPAVYCSPHIRVFGAAKPLQKNQVRIVGRNAARAYSVAPNRVFPKHAVPRLHESFCKSPAGRTSEFPRTPRALFHADFTCRCEGV